MVQGGLAHTMIEKVGSHHPPYIELVQSNEVELGRMKEIGQLVKKR